MKRVQLTVNSEWWEQLEYLARAEGQSAIEYIRTSVNLRDWVSKQLGGDNTLYLGEVGADGSLVNPEKINFVGVRATKRQTSAATWLASPVCASCR
jgi:hypothetical protein